MKKIFIVFLIFLFAVLLRFWNLYKMGRTWDEDAYVGLGYKFIELAKKGDFKNQYWYSNFDHPPLARYFYGFAAQKDYVGKRADGEPKFLYNFPTSRLVSVFLSSVSAVLVTFFAWEYISPFVGVASGVILSMLPFFLGFSQLATLETFIVFFFTASVYSFIKFLEKQFSKKWMIITGILTGLALLVKQSNALLFPLFGIFFLLWKWEKAKTQYRKYLDKKLLSFLFIPLISLLTFFILWPMPFLHLKEVIAFHNTMWVSRVQLPPPEVFFGRLMLVPKIYYPVMFLITTPLLVLLLFFAGILKIDKKKNWVYYALIWWFAFPFIQSLYPFKQHGVRYIIEIYAPLAIISAVGLEWIAKRFSKKAWFSYSLFGIIVLYLFFVLIKQSPYYLDYFNEFVGGSKGVYDSKTFQLGWWGQGTAEAVYYISSVAPKNARVGVIFNQVGVAPAPTNIHIEKYTDAKRFDYVVLNYFSVLREGYNAQKISKEYKKIHSVYANGAPIADIYEKK